jgi:hypothetical protein
MTVIGETVAPGTAGVSGAKEGSDVRGLPVATRAARLGGRFRLDERISMDEYAGPGWLPMWKATDELLGRPVTIYLLPAGRDVPAAVADAVRAAARVTDPRLATVYDTDFGATCPYIVAEWTYGTHLEDLVLSGLPSPALAAAMIADAADALAVAHRAGLAHLRLTPRSLRWSNATGLKISGLGIDAALADRNVGDPGSAEGKTADVKALARMLYALLTGYWPGDEPTALPPAPRYKGRVCTPRQVRAGVPALLDVITFRALAGEAPDAPLRPQTAAGLAMVLRMMWRPSSPHADADLQVDETRPTPDRPPRRHARARAGSGHRTTLLHPAA